MRTIKHGLFIKDKEYTCQHDWPASIFIQCGGNGLVLPLGSLEKTLSDPAEGLKVIAETVSSSSPSRGYRTAFMEIFEQGTFGFLRGQGPDLPAAERSVWAKWMKFKNCVGHEFTRTSPGGEEYRNGLGFCKHCGFSKSECFEPLERCSVCDKPTFHSRRDGKWFCADCLPPRCEMCEDELFGGENKNPEGAELVKCIDTTGRCSDGTQTWMCPSHFEHYSSLGIIKKADA